MFTTINWVTFLLALVGTIVFVRVLKFVVDKFGGVVTGKPPMKFFEPGEPWWLIKDPYHIHAFWFGMLDIVGLTDESKLTAEEKEQLKKNYHYRLGGQAIMIFAPSLFVAYVKFRSGGWDEGYSTFLAIAGALFNRPRKLAERVIATIWQY